MRKAALLRFYRRFETVIKDFVRFESVTFFSLKVCGTEQNVTETCDSNSK